jgi:myosin heavy subunit
MTVSKKILACNPVFEIFGNAQTGIDGEVYC